MRATSPLTLLVLVVNMAMGTLSAKSLQTPLSIPFSELKSGKSYPPRIAAIIRDALEIAESNSSLPYKFGGRRPSDGGFDCSGAMYYLLQRHGFKPPRTSAQQYLWARKANGFNPVGKTVRALDHKSFNNLRPGDLLFWSGTYSPTDGRTVKITHVGLYIGVCKKDGRQLMVCSSSGRSFRGRRCSGFGVYDFRLPSAKSRSTFVGYASLPPIKQ